jgi:hypothetical protein
VIVTVILRRQADSLGLHAQVDVFADQNDLALGLGLRQAIGDIENFMIRGLRREAPFQFGMERLTYLDHDPAKSIRDLDASIEEGIARQFVYGPQEFSRGEIERLVPLLEVIEFLDDRDGNNNIMLLKLVDALAVVQSNIGVENEGFPAFHLTATKAVRIE